MTVAGTYLVSASLTQSANTGDYIGCFVENGPGTLDEIGPSAQEQYDNISVDDEVTVAAGQTIAIGCEESGNDPATFFADGNRHRGPGRRKHRHERNQR